MVVVVVRRQVGVRGRIRGGGIIVLWHSTWGLLWLLCVEGYLESRGRRKVSGLSLIVT